MAESLYHDIGPANRLGIASVWVNRADRGGGTRRSDAVPDVEVADLGALARDSVCSVKVHHRRTRRAQSGVA